MKQSYNVNSETDFVSNPELFMWNTVEDRLLLQGELAM